MTLIKAVWRWLCRKRTACCSSNRLHFSHKVNYSNTGVYNFLPNAAGVSWDWCRPCPLCLVNGSPVFVLLKIVHTYRKKHCRWFPNNVSRMSSGKILATVLNVRSVRIDDQFKTFIFECSQYWQFMTSMAPIQYKTYICGMFCCYLLLYIYIFFWRQFGFDLLEWWTMMSTPFTHQVGHTARAFSEHTVLARNC